MPNEYKELDVVYHYTKLSTSLEMILHKGELRLTPRKNTTDPFENNKPFISIGAVGYYDDLVKLDSNKGLKTKQIIVEKYNSIRQISFCLNDKSHLNKIPIENHCGSGPYEYYGCIKPRMWDQYGDSYKGICLAFSLNQIIENLKKNNIKIIKGKIKYMKNSYIEKFDYGIDENELDNSEISAYINKYFERVEKRFFTKHHDYKDENELRLFTYSENQFVPFDISNCLVGIIYCKNFVPNVYLKLLETYAQTYFSNLTRISFGNNGIRIENTKY